MGKGRKEESGEDGSDEDSDEQDIEDDIRVKPAIVTDHFHSASKRCMGM